MSTREEGKGHPGEPGPDSGALLSIVVPAFNEERRLGPALEKLLAYLEARHRAAEIIVVDDGSADRTAETARSFAARGVETLRLESNRGKGYALRTGVLASSGDPVLLSDADFSTPIAELERLEPRIEEAELVFGSRAAAGARITQHQPIYRELMGKTFNLILRLLGVTRLRDTQCGFKLLRGPVARELFGELTVERFAFDVELLMLAVERGYRVVEVGVEWANSEASTVGPVTDSARMFWDVLRLRVKRLVGRRPKAGPA